MLHLYAVYGNQSCMVQALERNDQNSEFSHRLRDYGGEYFNPDRLNAGWCTDIIYKWTSDGLFI